jgi:hypothetical protein
MEILCGVTDVPVNVAQATKRRRKLTTPIYFPQSLNAAEAFHNAAFGTYRLSGVVLHSGTALGGHYRCYVSAGEAGWLDCNDANVTPLTAEEITQMFAPPAAAGAADAKGSFVHDNVYMLLYKAVDPANPDAAPGINLNELKQLIPAAVLTEVETENESFATRFKLQEIRNHVVALTVRVHSASDASAESSAASQPSTQLDLLKTATLATALERAHAQLVAEGKLSAADYPLSQCRLRKYSKRNQSSLGETFGGREGSVTLEDAGLTQTATLALEVRAANDPDFTEFNPSDMHLRFSVWDATANKLGAAHDVLVPGRDAATVGDLRAAAAAKLGADGSRLVLLHDDSTMPLEQLGADSDVLIAQHRIYPGDNTLVVEVIPADADAATYKSAALSALEEGRNKAVIYYNKPTDATIAATTVAEGANPEDATSAGDAVAQRGSNYPLSIEVSVDTTLAQFKALVAPTVGVSDVNSFHCKRSGAAGAPQLKDESKTLRDLAFVNHSVIHLQVQLRSFVFFLGTMHWHLYFRRWIHVGSVQFLSPTCHSLCSTLCITVTNCVFARFCVSSPQLGQGCKAGEHMLRIEVDPTSPTAALQSLTGEGSNSGETGAGAGIAGAAGPTCIALGEIGVSEKSSVLQLKQQLYAQWADLAAKCAADGANTVNAPKSAAHIRLRDGKAGKISGPLRDDRIVGRCLLGLADGRRLVAQVLDAPEQIAADDLVISLRVASFDKRILYPAVDLPITRSSTMRQLYDKILALVPQLNEPLPADYLQEFPAEAGTETISIAKGFTSGPALTLKTAFKLKWDEPAVLQALNDPTPPADATAAPVQVVTAEEASGDIDEATLERSRNLGSVGGLDRPPLNLRDGSIVVVRGKADFWRATLVMRARKAQEEALGEHAPPRRPTTAGAGAAAARNRKSVKERVAAADGGTGEGRQGSASADGSEDEVLVKGAVPAGSSKRGGGAERGLMIATSGSAKERPPVSTDQLA